MATCPTYQHDSETQEQPRQILRLVQQPRRQRRGETDEQFFYRLVQFLITDIEHGYFGRVRLMAESIKSLGDRMGVL